MFQFPFESRPLLIGALVVLIGAPTAGASMTTHARASAAPAPKSGPTLQIELVAPKEPVVAAAYPLETFEGAPIDEFKGRVPHGRAWRVGYDLDVAQAQMRAQPAGDYRGAMSQEARWEQARFELIRDDYARAERVRAARAQAAESRETPTDAYGDADPAG